MVPRILTDKIIDKIYKEKIIIIIGPRQVGKTTLARTLIDRIKENTIWLNGDEPDIRDILSGATSAVLKNVVGKNKIVVIDEAQRIFNVGITLKLFHDVLPEKQIIVTGSSALELANEINEPLTGRKYEYNLYPFSLSEMNEFNGFIDEKRLLEHRLVYGFYPDVVMNPGEENEILTSLTESYLYKDIFSWGKIKKPQILEKLLQALALQIGSEVKFHEIGQLIGADPKTVEHYVDLLEKAFVIFRLQSLSRNLRNEIKRGKKIYFYDNGIRNAVIKNFNPLLMRQDVGALWENFLISERIKKNHYSNNYVNQFFWRNHAMQEIDYIEEKNGKLYACEFKWNAKKKVFFSKSFLKAYKNSETFVINKKNYHEFLL
ncbi:MAG: ATP-binding protein [Deltaproteobacteria bacterium]|nr:ATP-binding protein [Deltaproteobacteria bacterium]